MKNLSPIHPPIQAYDYSHSNTDQLKWQRGLLYRDARAMFKKNVEFGAWLDLRCVAGDVTPDGARTIQRLMMAVELLSEQDFLKLGYTKAAELMDKGMWKDFPAETCIHNLRDKQPAQTI